jgi:hypothetical protein
MKRMTETKALMLVYAGVALATVLSVGPLLVVGAKGEWVGLSAILVTAAGADTVSRVSMHYAAKQGKHRRS